MWKDNLPTNEGLSAVLTLSVEKAYNVKSKAGVVFCVETTEKTSHTDMVVVDNKRKMANFDGASVGIKVAPHATNRAMSAVGAGRGSVEQRNLIKISLREESERGRSITEANVAVSQLLSSICGPDKFLVRLSRNVLVEGKVCVHSMESMIGKDYDVSFGSLTARSVQSEYFDEVEIDAMLSDTYNRTGKESSRVKFAAAGHDWSSCNSDSSDVLKLKKFESTTAACGESAVDLDEGSSSPGNRAGGIRNSGVWGWVRKVLCLFSAPSEH